MTPETRIFSYSFGLILDPPSTSLRAVSYKGRPDSQPERNRGMVLPIAFLCLISFFFFNGAALPEDFSLWMNEALQVFPSGRVGKLELSFTAIEIEHSQDSGSSFMF